MDCDGVLTDGRLYFSKDGEALKVFSARDGQGLALWHAAGFESGIISGRAAAEIIQARADELGIKYVYANSKEKSADCRKIVADAGVSLEETAFVGDDVGDVDVMKLVGLPIAVADAHDDVKAVATQITKATGGNGAIREVVEMLLDAGSS
jgi:YrbI family 3-deoxy-D-manno-octulosonate 8-phosphate phosphatase